MIAFAWGAGVVGGMRMALGVRSGGEVGRGRLEGGWEVTAMGVVSLWPLGCAKSPCKELPTPFRFLNVVEAAFDFPAQTVQLRETIVRPGLLIHQRRRQCHPRRAEPRRTSEYYRERCLFYADYGYAA